MVSCDLVVIGLGNPGSAYTGTRHNIGADILRSFSLALGVSLKDDRMLRASVGIGQLEEKSVLLAVPQTYMNESGDAVKRILQKTAVPLEHMLVVFDDLETPFGVQRVTFGGGARGHNGIRSIHAAIGSRAFFQLRVGIGRPVDEVVAEYVLSKFSHEERTKLTTEMAAPAEKAIWQWAMDVK